MTEEEGLAPAHRAQTRPLGARRDLLGAGSPHTSATFGATTSPELA
jgi:hypothetical protein